MILNEIADYTRKRVEKLKIKRSFDDVKQKAFTMNINNEFLFEKALKSEDMSFICEVKKASPSKGVIADDFPYIHIAKEYEKAGAAALSVLTEPKYFLGNDQYLDEICKAVSIPVLRKDFIIDSYQIYEAKILEASAVLLISELLDEKTLKEFIEIAHGLGISALVESHTERELQKAIKVGARIIGVNNRDLKTFEISLNTSKKLAKIVPEHAIFVSESGIKTPNDIKTLKENNVDAVLIGETLMRSSDKVRQLAILRGDIVD